jgi:hypothetical protein
MSDPTDLHSGIPARQINAPSPSFPERRAMISCSIVICTVSVPPRSTYHSGLSPLAAAVPCTGEDGRRAGDDARGGGTDGRERCTAELVTGGAAVSPSSCMLARAVATTGGRREPSAATASSEESM